MNERKSSIQTDPNKTPADWPLIVCAAKCIGDVARFILALEGRPGAVMVPMIHQPNWLESVRVTFRSTVPVYDLRAIAGAIPDCHRIAESMSQMAGGRR